MLMRMIDEQYLKRPFFGSRRMMLWLGAQGHSVNRKRVRRLMKLLGIEAIYPKPKTTRGNHEHRVYPYLLRGLRVDRPNQVWASDITYIPMRQGFLYLVAVLDWYSRYVISWRLSNTLDGAFCREALEEALLGNTPEIFNTDQGAQFTATAFTCRLEQAGKTPITSLIHSYVPRVPMRSLMRLNPRMSQNKIEASASRPANKSGCCSNSRASSGVKNCANCSRSCCTVSSCALRAKPEATPHAKSSINLDFNKSCPTCEDAERERLDLLPIIRMNRIADVALSNSPVIGLVISLLVRECSRHRVHWCDQIVARSIPQSTHQEITNMKFFHLAITLTFSVGSLLAADRPNILLFTADDLHAGSLGVYGGKVADLTPNLDAFAAESLLFSKAHVNVAICAPCRAVIATGRYSHRSGAMGFMPAREDVPDIVTTLKAAGYHTGILGKVGHSTPKKSMKWDYHFDQKDLGNGRNPGIYYERSRVFFKECQAENKPFYFMVNSHDPHRPYCNPNKLTAGAAMPSRIYSPKDVDVPGFLPDLPGVRAELATYLNSTRRLDDTFGKVMQALKESGEAENTLVLFITDNGIAVPFAKCNTWFHSTRSPLLVRWPGVVQPGTRDDRHFVSVVDFFPTFLDVAQVEAPSELDGRSFLPLLKGKSQEGREHVFTQIDSKAGGASVPMRCVQNENFGYIYNPFSDGKYWYRNNNEGKTMAAMNEAAKTNPAIRARVDLFRYRVPEEFYDLKHDPDCLHNLIDDAAYAEPLQALRDQLVAQMKRTKDPMLAAWENRNDRTKVDAVLLETYGPKKDERPGAKNRKRAKKNKSKM